MAGTVREREPLTAPHVRIYSALAAAETRSAIMRRVRTEAAPAHGLERQGMKLYRCYLYDPRQHTVTVRSARHSDDDAAVQWAQGLHQALPQYPAVDVWHGDKLVWRSDVTASKPDE